MKVGDLVQANMFANWSARQAKFGFVLDVIQEDDIDSDGALHPGRIRVLFFGGDIKALPTNHFEVISEPR